MTEVSLSTRPPFSSLSTYAHIYTRKHEQNETQERLERDKKKISGILDPITAWLTSFDDEGVCLYVSCIRIGVSHFHVKMHGTLSSNATGFMLEAANLEGLEGICK